MYQNTTQVYDSQQTVSHFDLTKFLSDFFFDSFFFKIFVGTNTALMLGLGTGEKTRKKKVKKLSSLFAFGFSSFHYSVIKFMKLNLVKFREKKDKLSPSYDLNFIKRLNILEIAFIFSSNDELNCLYSSIRFSKIKFFVKNIVVKPATNSIKS